MPSLQELNEALGINPEPEPQPVSPAPARPIQQPDDIFQFLIKGFEAKGSHFVNGNRHNYILSFAGDCNRYGVSQNDAINYFHRYIEKDFSGNEIRQIVKSVYESYSAEHGTKTYNPMERRERQTTPFNNKQAPNAKPAQPLENIFLIRTANACINAAKTQKIPPQLFYEFWHQGELSILFAGTGVGKTILAMQIAEELSKREKVLYFDFELSDKQFERRYSCNFTDHYQFSDNFLRIEINPEAENFSDEGLRFSIENTIVTTGSKIVFVDNITYLRSNLETSKDALPLMKNLKQLKKKYDISILCLAHTPKRDQTRPVTINDLSGSMQLANFADSVFAINFSAKDKTIRYVKQIKARATEIVYDTENVMICEIRNDHNFTRCHVLTFGNERDHLKEPTEDKKTAIELAVTELRKNNPYKSYRDIAKDLGIGKTTVERIIKKNYE